MIGHRKAIRHAGDAVTSDLETTEEPKSETSSSKSCFIKIPKDPYWVGKAMELHGLSQGNTAALHKYPAFEKSVLDVITKPPVIPNGEDTGGREFKETQQRVERVNEGTVLQNLMSLIIQRKYTGNQELQGEELERYTKELANADNETAREALKEGFLHTDRLWTKDGLLVIMTADSAKMLLPNQYADMGLGS
ncbi:MAG: hypothetical protein Q9217_001043 [Psora testacea]